ncbi:unnamed protein product [Heterobilharzia americana]|nr:unnamed protein product [Heterobilharzia americana]
MEMEVNASDSTNFKEIFEKGYEKLVNKPVEKHDIDITVIKPVNTRREEPKVEETTTLSTEMSSMREDEVITTEQTIPETKSTPTRKSSDYFDFS